MSKTGGPGVVVSGRLLFCLCVHGVWAPVAKIIYLAFLGHAFTSIFVTHLFVRFAFSGHVTKMGFDGLGGRKRCMGWVGVGARHGGWGDMYNCHQRCSARL